MLRKYLNKGQGNKTCMKRSFMPAYAYAMQLSEVPERITYKALKVYSRLLLKHATKGRNREILVKACINVTCKQLNYPFTYPKIERQEKYVNQVLRLSFKSIEAQMFVSKLGYDLGLSETNITKAINLVREEYGLAPATAAIHKVSGVSLRKLARLTGLSKNYIWRLSKQLKIFYIFI